MPFLKIFVSVDEKNGCRTSNNQIALNNIENAWHSLCEARSAQDAQTLASRVAFDEMGGQDMSVQAVAK